MADFFQSDTRGENRQHFVRELTALLASPTKFRCYAAYNEDQSPLALIVFGGSRGILEVPLLRVARSSLAPTIARYLVQYSILTACNENQNLVVVTDHFLSQSAADALHEGSFARVLQRWTRVILKVSESKDEIAQRLESLGHTFKTEAKVALEIAESLRKTSGSDTRKLADYEAILWPAKIVDADIPNFIIPIQARWAKDLFDEHLASQDLFGARVDLALNCEAVYYRARSQCGLTAPGRILWYVSQHDDFSGAGSIRACSRLDEFHVGNPKVLYRQFRRLGVYEWADVYRLAKQDINNEIMAIRFSDTELLSTPISWAEMQKTLTAEGIRSQIQTVTRIPNKLFAMLYAIGKK